MLAARPNGVPLLHVSPTPQPELAATCWLATFPPPSLLRHLFNPAAVAPASVKHSWRRKSDMIIGRSPAVEELLRTLDLVSPSSAPVLVTGESGTGKELVARALHYSGPRASRPFVAVNCAAIPATLFEEELFGHSRGAFTGAVAPRAGLVESADGGTLFLDEVGDLPLAMQPKLLRVIETGEVARLGSTDVLQTDVRLVTATNRNLEEEVAAGRFRADLYYRVRVFSLHLTPLRERPDDIPPLVAHFLALAAARDHRRTPTTTVAALRRLLSHQWPGNVRELINVLERALLLAPADGPIDAAHVLLPQSGGTPVIDSYRGARNRFEREYYSQLLRTTGGNVSLIAKLAKRTRTQVYAALRRLELDPERFRSDDGAGEGANKLPV